MGHISTVVLEPQTEILKVLKEDSGMCTYKVRENKLSQNFKKVLDSLGTKLAILL